jgi:hypothetical protein
MSVRVDLSQTRTLFDPLAVGGENIRRQRNEATVARSHDESFPERYVRR